MKKIFVHSAITALILSTLPNFASAAPVSNAVSKASLAALKVSLKPSNPNPNVVKNMVTAVLNQDPANLQKVQDFSAGASDDIRQAINDAIEEAGLVSPN